MADQDLPGDGLGRPDAGPRRLTWLLTVAVGETLTLAALLVNLLLTAHSGALAAALGPVHGAFYLGGVVLTWSGRFPRLVKLAAVVPVAGVWIAVGQARAHDRRPVDAPLAPG